MFFDSLKANLETMERKTNIFILDDNRYFGMLLAHQLEQEDRNIRFFYNEMDLVSRLHEKPDILILDHKLKYGTGLEILSIVKRKCGNTTNVIYLNAQEYLNINLKALQNGIVEYIKNGNSSRKYFRIRYTKNHNVHRQLLTSNQP